VRFVQSPLGMWVDGVLTPNAEARFRVGDEFVALLRWDEGYQRFRPVDERSMVPVRNGRISWQYDASGGIRDGILTAEFIELLTR